MKTVTLQILLTIILVCGLTFVGGAHVGLAEASTPVNGIIASDITWTKADSPYSLSGPVSINQGVTLTIEAGTTINLNNYYLQVNGTLNAKGTVSDQIKVNGGGITFTSSASLGSTIQEASFSKASVTIASSIKVANNYDAGLIVQEASPMISSNYNCSIEVHGGSAIISQNVNSSIVVEYGSPIITNNTLMGQIYLRGGNALVSNNVILYPTFFSIERGNPMIEGNLIATIIGVGGYATPSIQNNTFTGTHQGLSTSTGNVEIKLRYNNFQLDSGSIIYWGASNNLDASYNWWGTTDIQAINESIYDFKKDFTLGSVNFLPILTSPNPEAPAIPTIPEFPTIVPLILILILAVLTFYIRKKRK